MNQNSLLTTGTMFTYVMYDAPHLIKNVRNNLLTYDIIIGNEVISFDYISTLFDLEQTSVLRLVPKINKKAPRTQWFQADECKACHSGSVSVTQRS